MASIRCFPSLLYALVLLCPPYSLMAAGGKESPAKDSASTSRPDQPLAVGFTDEASVSWVLVPVVVRSSTGYVRNLGVDSFRLWVEDKRVAIGSFESGPGAPAALLYMQDLSGSMALGGKLADSRAALSCLLEQSRTEDLFALATFSFATARLQAPFTHDHATLGIAAEDWRPYGKTALHDAIATMPELHTAQGNRLKRAVVLVTDGADNASSLPPDTALGLLRRAKLPVYILYLNRAKTTNGAAAVAGVKGSDQLLRRLATMSGGRFFHLGNGFSIRQACRTISTELQHQYVLGFRIPGTGPSSHRRIRVDLGPGHGVPKPRLVHRQGYSGTTPP